MGRSLFAPGAWVMSRLGSLAGALLVCLLFLLPVLVALFGGAGMWLPVAILYVLAVYAQLARRHMVATGILHSVAITERIAGGEVLDASASALVQVGSGETRKLADAVAGMGANLAAVVRQVRSSAESISSAAQGIAEGSNLLSQRSQEQAASLEETVSGVEHLADMARQNAEGCARADGMASASRAVAAQAADRIRELAATMGDIEQGTRKVGEILGTVEGIAFQTNILALNAAVEAARAGDQGRGFAVVASEVRALAQRCSAAARDVQALVGRSIASVEKGRPLVDGAAGIMGEVVGSVERVTQELGAIAAASRAQSESAAEISQALAQVDATTQQNAALVEESASAAAAFQDEAQLLLSAVSRFKTDRSDDRGRVVAFVKEAVQHVRRHGAQRACADFNDPRGSFVRGEDYIIALDFQCRRLAYSPKPDSVGQNDWDATDADGKLFSREAVQLGQALGFGWIDYRARNPRTGNVERKSLYFERVGEMILSCGIYQRDAVRAAAAPVAMAARPLMPTPAR